MRRITVTTEIAAPVEVVWARLTDTASFASWNPFMPSLEGMLAVGEKLTVRITPPGGKGMTFRPTVTAVEENHRLEWLGRFLVPGLFDGRHSFTLEAIEGGTRLTHEETFTGVLVPLMASTLAKTEDGFRAMNEALRAEVAPA
ncbi:SRPBCC domain-containing protein [Actinophytocola sp.]|uniref:SRPBCC domain-containing protein n=1 Tax=Actinophytocola sp. TaxID=1872138 RepID=UPI002ED671FE